MSRATMAIIALVSASIMAGCGAGVPDGATLTAPGDGGMICAVGTPSFPCPTPNETCEIAQTNGTISVGACVPLCDGDGGACLP